MKNLRKKKFLLCLLVFLSLYGLWLGWHLIRHKTYKAPDKYPFPQEIEGVYHIHTLFSDGHKTPDQIAKLASVASLDFIILTDHGNPNYESLACQAWKEGVLVLAGSELSLSRGHLVGLDFKLPSYPFPQNTEEAVHHIRTLGGFSIISHPYSKTRWSWGEFIDYSGLEIINADSMLKENILLSIPFLPALLIKPEYTLLKMLDNPERNLKKWDELNRLHPTYGYFSVDAHLLYRPLLFLLRLHLSPSRPLSADFETARHQVYKSLREGKFYNAIDAAAEAKGFRFWSESDKKKTPMGGSAALDSSVTLRIKAPFSFTKEIYLIHNGKMILRSTKEKISHKAAKPGVYRVEIYLKERSPLNKNIPWIVSNPIFLREKKSDDHKY